MQTIQCSKEKGQEKFEYTKWVIRSCKSEVRQYNGLKEKGQEKFEYTKRTIRIRKSERGRQYNGHKKGIKRPTLHRKLKIEQHEPHKTLETG